MGLINKLDIRNEFGSSMGIHLFGMGLINKVDIRNEFGSSMGIHL